MILEREEKISTIRDRFGKKRKKGNIQKQSSTCLTASRFFLIEKSTFKLMRTYLVTFILREPFYMFFGNLFINWEEIET